MQPLLQQARLRALAGTRRAHQDDDLGHKEFPIADCRLPISDWLLIGSNDFKSAIGIWQSKMSSRSAPTQSPAAAQKTFIVPHDELGFDLCDRVHCYADENQQRRAAKVELITHAGRNPLHAGSGAHE